MTTLGFTWFLTSWKMMKWISFLSCRSDHRPEHRTMIKPREVNHYSPLALAAPDWNQRKRNQYSNIRMRAEQIFFYHVPSLCYSFNAVFIDRLLYCYWVALLLRSEAYTLKSYFCTANPIFTHSETYTRASAFFRASGWIMPAYEHSTNLFKKLEMSMQPTFITLTGIPQQLSVTVSVTTNSGVQWEMKSAEGQEWGRVVRRLHTKCPILCSRHRQKRFIKTAPRTISPRLPLSPWGPWWREEETQRHSITAGKQAQVT